MRRATLLAVLVACSSKPSPVQEPQPTRSPEPPAPTLRLGDAVTAVQYDATLEIDPAQDGFRGELRMDARLAAPASMVWLNADRLTIREAHAVVGDEEIALEVVPQPEDFVGLRAPVDLPAGELTFVFVYDGVFETNDSMGAFVQPVDGTRYVFTQLEALGARRVFPCVDEPSSKVPWRLSIVVPDGNVAISNTPVADEQALDDGRRKITFVRTRPLPTYLVAFAVGPFDFVDAGATPGGAPIRVAAFRGQAAQAGHSATDASRVMGMLEDYFGRPYPYEKLDFVPIPTTTWFSAMENAGMITFRQDVLFHDTWTDIDRQTFVWFLAHEGAHQWFGDLVTMAWWDDLWLNEAFASWFEEKVMSSFQPGWVAAETWIERRSRALQSDGLVTARMIRQPIAERSDIQSAFDNITYWKGATVIRMFERWIGAETFRDGVRAYLEAHQDGNATSADFLAAIDAVTELDVTAAFATFLDQAGAPRVAATLACPKGGKPVVTLTQDRWLPRGATAPAGDAPRWTFPVCVAYGDGKQRGEACATMTEAQHEVTLDAAACPKWILPNADGVGYYRVALGASELDAVLDHGWPQLADPERLLLASDVTAMVARGDATFGDQLDIATRLGTKASKEALRVAVTTAWTAKDVASDAAAPELAKWIRDTFGKDAAKLGWQAGKDDTADTTNRRDLLVPLVAYAGEDDKLLRRAEVIAKPWPKLPEADRARVMSGAARRGQTARDLLIPSLRSKDQREVGDAVTALGNVDDPEAAKPILEALLDPEVDLQIATRLFGALAAHDDVQPVVAAFLRDHWAELLPRIPEQNVAGMIGVFTASCDAADRPAIEAWADEHLADAIGGPRAIAQALESLDQCVARRAALGPELDAWLAARKKR